MASKNNLEEKPSEAVAAAAAAPGAAEVHSSGDDISPITTSEKNVDDAYRVFAKTQDLDASPAEIKHVISKIDWHVVPILFVTYMLQYLDKNSLNFASVYGLQEGTHLKGQDYSWLGE